MKRYIEVAEGPSDYTPRSIESKKLIDEDHSFLFNFISYDLSEAERMMKEYLSCLGDESEPDRDKLTRVTEELQKAHPLFSYCPECASWIENRIMAGHIKSCYKDRSEDEQRELFKSICMVPEYKSNASREISEYVSTYTDEAFDNHIVAKEDHVFSEIMHLQKSLKGWIFFVLDDSNPELAAYSTKVRAKAYDDNFGGPGLVIKTKMRPSLTISDLNLHFANLSEGNDTGKVIDEKYLEKGREEMEAMMEQDPDGELPETIRRFFEIVDVYQETKEAGEPDVGVDTVTVLDGFAELLRYEVYGMIESRTV